MEGKDHKIIYMEQIHLKAKQADEVSMSVKEEPLFEQAENTKETNASVTISDEVKNEDEFLWSCVSHSCSFCAYKTTDEESFKKHSNLHCLLCGLFCNRENDATVLQHHILSHKKETNFVWFQCSTCPLLTIDEVAINNHVQQHIKKEERPYKKVETAFGHHLFIKYLANYTPLIQKLYTHAITNDDTKYDDYDCPLCDVRSKFFGEFKAHIKSEHDNNSFVYNCLICKFTTIYKKHIEEHSDQHTRGVYYCPPCEFQSTENMYNAFENHLLTHEFMSFKCGFCEFKTTFKADYKKHNLEQHINYVHSEKNNATTNSEDDEFQCTLCTFKAKSKKSLKGHFTRIHVNKCAVQQKYEAGNIESSYQCPYCNYRAKFDRYVTQHVANMHTKQNVETGSFKYKCLLCNYQTNQSSNFRRHNKLVHIQDTSNNKQTRLLSCTKCQYMTQCRSNFRRHLKVHLSDDEITVYQCQFCEVTFRHHASFIKHLKTKHDIDQHKNGVSKESEIDASVDSYYGNISDNVESDSFQNIQNSTDSDTEYDFSSLSNVETVLHEIKNE